MVQRGSRTQTNLHGDELDAGCGRRLCHAGVPHAGAPAVPPGQSFQCSQLWHRQVGAPNATLAQGPAGSSSTPAGAAMGGGVELSRREHGVALRMLARSDRCCWTADRGCQQRQRHRCEIPCHLRCTVKRRHRGLQKKTARDVQRASDQPARWATAVLLFMSSRPPLAPTPQPPWAHDVGGLMKTWCAVTCSDHTTMFKTFQS